MSREPPLMTQRELKATTADFVCTPDPNESYLRMWIAPKGGDPLMYRLSVGAGEVLAAEINGITRPPASNDVVERVARAIYDAPDTQSGDQVGDVIWASEHLFYETAKGECVADLARRVTMGVCRDAARAAIAAIEPSPLQEMREAGEKAVGEAVMRRFYELVDDPIAREQSVVEMGRAAILAVREASRGD